MPEHRTCTFRYVCLETRYKKGINFLNIGMCAVFIIPVKVSECAVSGVEENKCSFAQEGRCYVNHSC